MDNVRTEGQHSVLRTPYKVGHESQPEHSLGRASCEAWRALALHGCSLIGSVLRPKYPGLAANLTNQVNSTSLVSRVSYGIITRDHITLLLSGEGWIWREEGRKRRKGEGKKGKR